MNEGGTSGRLAAASTVRLVRQKVQSVERHRSAPVRQKVGSRRALFFSLALAAVGAIIAVVFLLPTYLVDRDLEGRPKKVLTPTELLKAKNDVRTTLLQAVGGLVLFSGAVAAWRQLRLGREQLMASQQQAQRNEEIARSAQITERFTRAIDQLGSNEMDVRVGGIYALERIAKDSNEDHGPVMEVLAAFLREHSPRNQTTDSGRGEESPIRIRADIQAAATVLGRRRIENDLPRRPIDLREVDLAGANLHRANLSNTNFEGATLRSADFVLADLGGGLLKGTDLREATFLLTNLERAWLERANLQGVDLSTTKLHRATLSGANLQGAVLGALLQSADMTEASLTDANLRGADLRGADLRGANLQGADLREANFTGVRASSETFWPQGFDPVNAGVEIETEPGEVAAD